MEVWNAPGRLAAIYPVHGTTTARGGFLFRRSEESGVDHRDIDGQKRLLHTIYGRDGWQVPRLLAEMDAATDFYFDSISQIVMDSWVKGRVTLVGDAGYSPGPAVGGGTSIAMVGAYVLAQELAQAGRNVQKGLTAYQDRMRRARRQGPQYRTQHHVHADPADEHPSPATAGVAPPGHPDAATHSTAPVPVAGNTRPGPGLHPPDPFTSRRVGELHRSLDPHPGWRAGGLDPIVGPASYPPCHQVGWER